MEKTDKLQEEVENNSDEQVQNDLANTIQKLEEKLVRSYAENENTRKRYKKMIDEAEDYAVTKFAKDMLTVMDNLNLALAHKDETNVIAGVELTQKELKSLFDKYGIEEIVPKLGEKFDYNFHNAISEIESDKHDAGSVLNIMQSGYKLKDRLLRPAFVSVSKK